MSTILQGSDKVLVFLAGVFGLRRSYKRLVNTFENLGKNAKMEQSLFDVHEELENRHWWFVARRQIIRNILVNLLGDNDQHLIVDVGCGTGGTVDFLSKDFRTVGVDNSKIAIDKATCLYPTQTYMCADAGRVLGDQKQNISAILLMDVLEHIENDKAFLMGLLENLPVGVKILITVPARNVLWSRHDVIAHHFRRYESEDLKALWLGANVKQICLSYFNSRLYPIIRIIRFLRNRLNGSFGRHETDFSLPPSFLNRLLTKIFVGETDRILSVIRGYNSRSYTIGASLIAVLEVTEEGTGYV